MNGGNAPAQHVEPHHQRRPQERVLRARISQWTWVWGQFLDHTFGLRNDTGNGATAANIPFSSADPLEEFTNNLGVIPFTRSAAAPGTGHQHQQPAPADQHAGVVHQRQRGLRRGQRPPRLAA
jgi:hypothetical protein